MISAIVIARNEERHIRKCVEALSFCGEILVIDNGSTDNTVKIAKKSGAKVIHYKTPANEGHFSEVRNFAKGKAKGEWLLFVDADEVVTKELREEIITTTDNSQISESGFAIPRRNVLLGHEMHWGGWSPDHVLRLIKKDRLKGYEGKVHEQPKIEGSIGKLKNPFMHYTHESLTEMVEKTNKWSEIEAKLMFDAGHPKMNIPRFATAVLREFWYRAVVKLGFLDGPIGIIEIIYQCFSRFVSYAKLYEMQLKEGKV